MSETSVLSVRHLWKLITLHLLGEKQVTAISDVSFDVPAGAFVAVVGASGSGKSSLLKCIYRTYLSSRGQILFHSSDGALIDLASASEQEIIQLRTSEIRYVSQFLQAPPRIPAIDVVARPLIESGCDQQAASQRAREMLAALGIGDELSSSFPALFSGGEKQRINVARALVSPARLMLFDEPTSALDAENRERVRTQLAELKRQGSTIIGVFHDRALLAELADRILVMESGRLSALGTVKEVDISRFVGSPEPALEPGG